MIKKILLITLIIILNSKVYAEFEKEVKLTDEGKCEEALAENTKTSIEQEENFNPKKPFIDKHTIKIFRVYSLNRKIQILDKNCNKKKEAFELAKKSLKLEKELSKIPLKEIDKVLKYDDFQRKINLAGAHTQLANLYNNNSELKNKIKLYEDAVKILESTDLYNKNNLLDYNYSILSNFYIKIGNFKQAEKFKNKNLDYMKNRYGEGTSEYAEAFTNLYFLYQDQGHYDYALQTLLDIQKNVDVNLLYKNSEGDHNMSQIKFTHLLGKAYYRINDYDNAIESNYKVLNYIKSQKSLVKEEKKINNILLWENVVLGDLALYIESKFYQTGDLKYLDDAEKIYLQVINIQETSNNQKMKDELFITKDNLSSIYLSRNENEKALPLVEEAYAECVRINNEKDKICMGQMISTANVISFFNLPKSIDMLEKFLKLEHKTNDSFLRQRVNARGSLSYMYSQIGNNKRADELMIESINLIDPTDSRFRDVYANQMNSYYLSVSKSGQARSAVNGYLELIEFINENVSDVGNILPEVFNNLGFAYSLIPDQKKALKFYLESEIIGKKFNRNRGLATSRMNIAEIYFSTGKNDKANEYYKLALENSKFIPLKKKIMLYAGLTKTEVIKDNYDQALIYATEGLKIAEQHLGKNHPSNLALLDSLALVNSFKKNYNGKFKNLTAIYNIINDYSNGYLTENFNAEQNEYFAQIWSFLYVAAERNDSKNEEEKFKNFFEANSLDTMNNAIFNLTETLRTTKVSIDTNKMIRRNFFENSSKQVKLRLLDEKIEEYSKIPKYVSNQEDKKKLIIKINKSKKEIEGLKNELEFGKILKGDSFIFQDINIKDVQKSLGKDEAILHYISYPNNLYFGLISKEDFKFFYKNYSNNEISSYVQKIRSSINYNNGVLSKFDYQSSKKLYDELIRPFKKDIVDKKKLIIIPHGPLLSIPFEVLVDVIPEENSLQNSNWLIKNFNIKYHPSVSSSYLMNKNKSKNNKNYFAGYGDPVLTKNKEKIVLDSKVSKNLFSRGGLADIERIKELPELPKTSYELTEVSKNFNNKDLFLRSDFNETNIKSEELSKYSVISFATHGIIANELDGVFEPGLITSPPNKAGKIDDGVLTSSEIKKLNLNAELIILSACNTAASDGSANSEGLSGLASSFFYAGAKSLLVSHWYVEDETTVDLMKNTFNNLKETNNMSQSLRNVKISMINKDNTAHPIFWAPFILIGG